MKKHLFKKVACKKNIYIFMIYEDIIQMIKEPKLTSYFIRIYIINGLVVKTSGYFKKHMMPAQQQ